MSEVLARQQSGRRPSWGYLDDGGGAVEYPLRKSIMRFDPRPERIRIEIHDVIAAKHTPYHRHEPKYTQEDWDLFQTLIALWKRERGASSSLSDFIMSPSYQSIIGLGEKAIPMILRQMETEGARPDHWDWALRSITREDVVPESEWGDTRAIAARWKRWARTKYGW